MKLNIFAFENGAAVLTVSTYMHLYLDKEEVFRRI